MKAEARLGKCLVSVGVDDDHLVLLGEADVCIEQKISTTGIYNGPSRYPDPMEPLVQVTVGQVTTISVANFTFPDLSVLRKPAVRLQSTGKNGNVTTLTCPEFAVLDDHTVKLLAPYTITFKGTWVYKLRGALQVCRERIRRLFRRKIRIEREWWEDE